MRFLVALLVACGLPLGAQDWAIQRLFSRPSIWGTSPDKLKWSKKGHTLAFLWNDAGGQFRDLYAYHPDSGKLVRLTRMQNVKDEINLSEAEKDPRQKLYVPPDSGIGQFDLFADGTKVAFSFKGDIYLVATDASQQPLRLTKTKSAELAPSFASDGKRIAFTRDSQLFVQNLTTGQLTQVTQLEPPAATLDGYHWSPDGTHLAYWVVKGTSRLMPLPNYSGRFVKAPLFRRGVAGDPPDEMAIFVTDSDGEKTKEMELGSYGGRVWLDGEPSWSPDSTRLLYKPTHQKQKKQQILVLDAGTGKTTCLFEETDDRWTNEMFAGWSSDGKSVLFTSEKTGWSHLYTIPARGGTLAQLTSGDWEIHTDTFSEDPQWIGDWIYFSSTEEGPSTRQFYRIRPDGTGKEKLSKQRGLNIGKVSEDGRFTARLFADDRNPFDLYVNEVRVTTSPLPEFARYDWPTPRHASTPSRGDRKPVAIKVYFPSGYSNGKRYPAVVYVHGSGYATSALAQWGAYHEQRFVFNMLLAHKGFVVIEPDYRGSAGYGRDWRTGIYLNMGGLDLQDVLGCVDYLRGLGNIDLNRVGIWGVSYGGFMTNTAMFRAADTFRAGASWAAVNDWQNYNSWYTGQRLTTPQENPEAYRRSSPIYFSSLLKNPLLIVHGMVDDNVLFQDAVQLSEELIREHKDFSQIYYPEESHGFVRDETLIDAYQRTFTWFEQHLK